jgi:hypothetical protein
MMDKSPAPNLSSLTVVSTTCDANNRLTAVIQQMGYGTFYVPQSFYLVSETQSYILNGNTIVGWKYTLVLSSNGGNPSSNSFQIDVYAIGIQGGVITINKSVSCPKS